MRRQDSRRIVRVIARALLIVLAFMLAASATSAAQTEGRPRWRTSRYGRQGAEIWLEAPRLGVATGSGYKNGVPLPLDVTDDLDLTAGFGFGFGIMFAASDRIGFEARIVQTTHRTSAADVSWDLDQIHVGGRYLFLHDRPIQVFVGAGGARSTLEYDSSESLVTGFQRLSGYGWYVTTGVDYIVSSRWVVSFRTDYTVMRYGRIIVGTNEQDIEDAFDGSSLGIAFTFSYRVPVWW